MKKYSIAALEEDKLYARVSPNGSLTYFLETPFDDLVRLTDRHLIETAGYVPAISDVTLKYVVDGFYK